MGSQKTIRQEFGTVSGTPVRLDGDEAEQSIDALNADLAATCVLSHPLHRLHWFDDDAEDADEPRSVLDDDMPVLESVTH